MNYLFAQLANQTSFQILTLGNNWILLIFRDFATIWVWFQPIFVFSFSIIGIEDFFLSIMRDAL